MILLWCLLALLGCALAEDTETSGIPGPSVKASTMVVPVNREVFFTFEAKGMTEFCIDFGGTVYGFGVEEDQFEMRYVFRETGEFPCAVKVKVDGVWTDYGPESGYPVLYRGQGGYPGDND